MSAHTAPDLRVSVLGVGLLGPGLADWTTGRSILQDASTWTSAPTAVPPPTRLPPAERRRAGTIVKLGIGVADQACAQAGVDTATLATVFTASSGDGANCHALCESLATPARLVSPTRFTNSVHNASAGYWHIATASRAPSTSLCAHDASFAAGLLEAVSQCLASGLPVLLVAADTPYPEPLNSARPLPDSFATALVLAPGAVAESLATLTLSLTAAPTDRCTASGLETMRSAIPAARALPLLSALASSAPIGLVIEYQPGLGLQIDVQPGARA